MMLRRFVVSSVIVGFLGLGLGAQPPGKEPPKAAPSNPEAALQAFKQALEAGDVVALANLTAGPPGVTLRKLAPPLKKAQDASEKFDHALAEKPALAFTNPFQNELNPLRGYHLEVVELSKEKNQQLARIRFGHGSQSAEETVRIQPEDGLWRVSLPGEFLKSIQRLTSDRLARQMESLTKLSEVLQQLAEEVRAGKFSTKEALLVRLAERIKEAKLAEPSKGPGK